MSKLFDIFYYVVPGASVLFAILFSYWDAFYMNNFFRFLADNTNLFVLFSVFISAITGLFIEGLSKILFGVLCDCCRKESVHTINRFLFYHQKRELPEYFSFRASIFRNLALAIPVSLIIMMRLLTHSSNFQLYVTIMLIFTVLSLHLYCKNEQKEMSVLEGYRKDKKADRLEPSNKP